MEEWEKSAGAKSQKIPKFEAFDRCDKSRERVKRPSTKVTRQSVTLIGRQLAQIL